MRSVDIEFLYLDRETCGRCRDTEASLLAAIDRAGETLRDRGRAVSLRSVHVTSAAQASALRFESSPTIRVNGRDIAGRLIESPCESGACACADGAIDCRLWSDGEEQLAAPTVDMVIDALLTAAEAPATTDPAPFVLPANLERYFAEHRDACCDERSAAICGEPDEKPSCCGDGETCGCS